MQGALVCKFAKNKLGLPPGNYRGLLNIKFRYTGPGGDPEGDGTANGQ